MSRGALLGDDDATGAVAAPSWEARDAFRAALRVPGAPATTASAGVAFAIGAANTAATATASAAVIAATACTATTERPSCAWLANPAALTGAATVTTNSTCGLAAASTSAAAIIRAAGGLAGATVASLTTVAAAALSAMSTVESPAAAGTSRYDHAIVQLVTVLADVGLAASAVPRFCRRPGRRDRDVAHAIRNRKVLLRAGVVEDFLTSFRLVRARPMNLRRPGPWAP
jgi:hypothetical protein